MCDDGFLQSTKYVALYKLMLLSVNTTLNSGIIRLHVSAKNEVTIRPNYKNTKGGVFYNCVSGL